MTKTAAAIVFAVIALAAGSAAAKPIIGPMPKDEWGQQIYCSQVYSSLTAQYRLYFDGSDDDNAPVFKRVRSAMYKATRSLAQAGIKSRSLKEWSAAKLTPSFVMPDIAREVSACDSRFGFTVAKDLPPVKPLGKRPTLELRGVDPWKLSCDGVVRVRDALSAEINWVRTEQRRQGDTNFRSDLMTAAEGGGMHGAVYGHIANLNRTGVCSGKIALPDDGPVTGIFVGRKAEVGKSAK